MITVPVLYNATRACRCMPPRAAIAKPTARCYRLSMPSDPPGRMTPKAKRAWKTYRDLGPARTLEQAAKLLGYSPRSKSLLERWSQRHGWQRLAPEHDHAVLRKSLGQREIIREQAQQRLIDALDQAVGVLLEIMLDRSQLPVLDRHGQHELDADGNKVYRFQVKQSTRALCAEKVLGLGGLVPVKRTEVVDRTGESLDEAAAVMESMHPDDLDAFMKRLRARNKEQDGPE